MRGNETLNQILEVLRDLGGYFTFSDEVGEEYIIVRKQDATALQGGLPEPEVQLALPPSPPINTADELLDRINRDIAMYQEAQEQFDDLAISEEVQDGASAEASKTLPPPRRVRFEPLRGDLPPDLQE